MNFTVHCCVAGWLSLSSSCTFSDTPLNASDKKDQPAKNLCFPLYTDNRYPRSFPRGPVAGRFGSDTGSICFSCHGERLLTATHRIPPKLGHPSNPLGEILNSCAKR
jgi:hypothetical protein